VFPEITVQATTTGASRRPQNAIKLCAMLLSKLGGLCSTVSANGARPMSKPGATRPHKVGGQQVIFKVISQTIPDRVYMTDNARSKLAAHQGDPQ
jgi:hypothetical protein